MITSMENLKENNQEFKIEKPEVYTSPSIEVVEVVVEQGFGPSEDGEPSF